MLEEIQNNIINNVNFVAQDKFKKLIEKTITVAFISGEDDPNLVSISFKFRELLEGLIFFANSKGKQYSYQLGTEALLTITNALLFELEPSEAFLLFHLRNLGKFRKKETELYEELQKLWNNSKQSSTESSIYEMTKQEFSKTLKKLMREKFIQYRKGNIHLNPSFVVRYRC